MRTRVGALATCLFVAGCGGGGHQPPQPISGPAKQVAGVVERFAAATAHQDFTTICNDLLATATRKQAGGADCPAVLSARAHGVRNPRIVIKGIELRGRTASVRVRTTASGQAPTSDVIDLVQEHGQYRISSLGR